MTLTDEQHERFTSTDALSSGWSQPATPTSSSVAIWRGMTLSVRPVGPDAWRGAVVRFGASVTAADEATPEAARRFAQQAAFNALSAAERRKILAKI